MTEVAGGARLARFASVTVAEPMMLDAVKVTKADGRIFVYYVFPDKPPLWSVRKRLARTEAIRSIRAYNEPPGEVFTAVYETPSNRGWKPCR